MFLNTSFVALCRAAANVLFSIRRATSVTDIITKIKTNKKCLKCVYCATEQQQLHNVNDYCSYMFCILLTNNKLLVLQCLVDTTDTDKTRQDKTVLSRRCRQCELGIIFLELSETHRCMMSVLHIQGGPKKWTIFKSA